MSELKSDDIEQVKSSTKFELAESYGVTSRTLRSWMHRCGFYSAYPEARYCKILMPKHIEFLVSKFDKPDE